MKRTFLARRNALLSSTDVSWGVGALAFVFLVFLFRFVTPNLFLQVTAPVFRAADFFSVTSRTFFGSFGDINKLAARNEQLREENVALANENQALLQKGVSQKALGAGIIAGVVSRPPTSPYDTLVLALGSRAGVTLGQEAFGEGGVPLGFVSSVLADFSRVTLFTSPNMIVDGWVGSAKLPLTLYGAGGGALRASTARAAGIVEGDAIFAPGPGSLPIAYVVRIDSDPASPTATLQIQPAANLFSVTWVELRDTGPAFAASLTWATSTAP